MAKKILVALFVGAMVMTPLLVAQSAVTAPPTDTMSVEDFYDVIVLVRNWIYTFLLVIVVILLLYAAFLFITASGSEEKVTQARTMVKWAVVGIVLMMIAGAAVAIIESILDSAGGAAPGPRPINGR